MTDEDLKTYLYIIIIAIIIYLLYYFSTQKTEGFWSEGDDGSESSYYNYRPVYNKHFLNTWNVGSDGNQYYFGKNEVIPPSTMIVGSNSIDRPGNNYNINAIESNIKPTIIIALISAKPICRGKLDHAFFNTKKEIQSMEYFNKTIEFEEILYDRDEAESLGYKLPIVVKIMYNWTENYGCSEN